MKANENENRTIQNLWDSTKAVIRSISNTGLPQEAKKSQIYNLIPTTPKGARKRTVDKA